VLKPETIPTLPELEFFSLEEIENNSNAMDVETCGFKKQKHIYKSYHKIKRNKK